MSWKKACGMTFWLIRAGRRFHDHGLILIRTFFLQVKRKFWSPTVISSFLDPIFIRSCHSLAQLRCQIIRSKCHWWFLQEQVDHSNLKSFILLQFHPSSSISRWTFNPFISWDSYIAPKNACSDLSRVGMSVPSFEGTIILPWLFLTQILRLPWRWNLSVIIF